MSKDVLFNSVLMLNRGWSAIGLHSAKHVIPMMATDAAVALDISGTDITPVRWDEWVKLPIRDGDDVIHTCRLQIRVPTVVVCSSYGKMPHRRPKKNLRGVSARDGNRCQYTGKTLAPEERSIDHVLPKDRGGSDDWENLVLAEKGLNHSKGNKLNEEIGLKLLRKPFEPRSLPASSFIQTTHPHHLMFLHK